MERGSDKVSPRQDEQLKHDTEGLVRGGHATRAEEWKGSEPAGEDQPEVSRTPHPQPGGDTNGMTNADIEGRAELAKFLGRAPYPMVREQVLELVMDRQAPDRVVDEVRRLPSGRTFSNVQEIWTALG